MMWRNSCMRLVSTSTMVKELEQKVQDCEERLRTSRARLRSGRLRKSAKRTGN